MSVDPSRKPLVIVGTSGSHDYLNDATGKRRFWPVRAPSSIGPVEALSPKDRALLDELIGLTADRRVK